MVDWFPADPISDDWLGKEGVLPAVIVFLSQEEADVAGDPKGDTHEEEPAPVPVTAAAAIAESSGNNVFL